MILLLIVKISLMIKLVSLQYLQSPILDSSLTMDHMVTFRKSGCYSTVDEQEKMINDMISPPKYKGWQRPGLSANGNNTAIPPLQVLTIVG